VRCRTPPTAHCPSGPATIRPSGVSRQVRFGRHAPTGSAVGVPSATRCGWGGHMTPRYRICMETPLAPMPEAGMRRLLSGRPHRPFSNPQGQIPGLPVRWARDRLRGPRAKGRRARSMPAPPIRAAAAACRRPRLTRVEPGLRIMHRPRGARWTKGPKVQAMAGSYPGRVIPRTVHRESVDSRRPGGFPGGAAQDGTGRRIPTPTAHGGDRRRGSRRRRHCAVVCPMTPCRAHPAGEAGPGIACGEAIAGRDTGQARGGGSAHGVGTEWVSRHRPPPPPARVRRARTGQGREGRAGRLTGDLAAMGLHDGRAPRNVPPTHHHRHRAGRGPGPERGLRPA